MIIKRNYKVKKGFSLNYYKYRILRPLLKINYYFFRRKVKNAPWLAPETIQFLNNNLTSEMIGLEYGSGFSTIFLCERSKHIVSIEHHEEWYEKIKNILEERGVKNVEYVYCPEGESEKSMESIIPKEMNYSNYGRKKNFGNYIDVANKFDDGYFDYAIIDGRARVETFMVSLKKVKKGGFIILDNAERPSYQVIHELMSRHKKIFHTTGLTDTVIWYI